MNQRYGIVALTVVWGLLAGPPANAKSLGVIIVEQNLTGNSPSKMEIEITKGKLKDEVIWVSESDIRCLLGTYAEEAKGSFECTGPGDYKVQTVVNCEINKTKDTAAYLFVGKVGKTGGHRNFHFYCK